MGSGCVANRTVCLGCMSCWCFHAGPCSKLCAHSCGRRVHFWPRAVWSHWRPATHRCPADETHRATGRCLACGAGPPLGHYLVLSMLAWSNLQFPAWPMTSADSRGDFFKPRQSKRVHSCPRRFVCFLHARFQPYPHCHDVTLQGPCLSVSHVPRLLHGCCRPVASYHGLRRSSLLGSDAISLLLVRVGRRPLDVTCWHLCLLCPCTSLSSRFPSFCSICSTSCRWLPLPASLLRASLQTFLLKAFALMSGT